MEKEQRRVTSEDVARASGVSRATVSYVLNNDPRQSIPLETRERVLKIARELGYRPSTAARILRGGYSRIVLVVLQFEMVDPAMARSLKELEAVLAEKGFSLIWYVGVHTTSEHIHPSTNLTPAVIVSLVDESNADISEFLRQFNVPILSMNSETTRQPVGKAQVSYLVERGHRRMVFAAPERQDVQWLAQARLDGVLQSCIEHQLDHPHRRGSALLLAKGHEKPSCTCSHSSHRPLACVATTTKWPLQSWQLAQTWLSRFQIRSR